VIGSELIFVFPVKKGAKALIDESKFSVAKVGSTYVAPQVYVNVDHNMLVMNEETLYVQIGFTPA